MTTDRILERCVKIEKRALELDEGVKRIMSLIFKLLQHSDHIVTNLKDLTQRQSFFQIYSNVDPTLARYVGALVEMKCRLELLLINEIRKWNSVCEFDESVGMRAFDKDFALESERHLNSSHCGENYLECERSNTDNKPCPHLNRACYSVKEHREERATSASEVKSQALGGACSTKPEAVPFSNNEKVPSQVPSEFDSMVDDPSDGRIKTLNKMFTPNRKYKGHVIYVATLSEMYISFVTEEILLIERGLRYEWQMILESGSADVLPSVQCGAYAMYNSSEHGFNLFHRVQVVESLRDDGLVKVYLLDSGWTEVVSPDKLYELPECLFHYPALATTCRLTGVTPSDGALARTRDWVRKNDEVVIVVTRGDGTVSLPVELYNSTETECLNRKLMETDGDFDEWNPMMEDFRSTKNTYDLDVDDPAFAIYGYVGKDYVRACKEFAQRGKCFKGDSCRKEHILLDPHGYTTDKEDVYISSFNMLEIPSPQEEVAVIVTHVVSSTKFYCVLGGQLNVSDEGEETLTSLIDYMNDKKIIGQYKKLSTPPALGQMVITKSQREPPWHRGRVVEVLPEKEKCTVFLVDVGSTEMASLCDLRAMEPCYLHLPFQAVFCDLDGCEGISEGGREHIERGVRIRVIGVVPGERPHLVVKLYDGEGGDIGEILARENLVKPKENLILDEEEMVLPG